MGKTILDIISKLVTITGNDLIDTILVSLIGLVSFSIAFGIVGQLFDFIGVYDSDVMSDTHWLVRIGVFLLLTWITSKLFECIAWLFSFSWWVYLILFFALLILAITGYIVVHIVRNRKAGIVECDTQQVQQTEITQQVNPSMPVVDNSKQYCPRCKSLLVKRHGPYGTFYGCSAYGNTGCRYTRKNL